MAIITKANYLKNNMANSDISYLWLHYTNKQ